MNTLSKNVLISIVVSMLFHLLMFCCLFKMDVGTLPGTSILRDEENERIYQLTLTRPKDEDKKKQPNVGNGSGEGGESPEDTAKEEKALSKVFEQQQLTDPYPVKLNLDGIAKTELPKPQVKMEIKAATAPRPELIAIKNLDIIHPGVPKHTLIPEVERKDVDKLELPSLLPHGPMTGNGSAHNVGMRMGMPNFAKPRDITDEALLRGVTGIHRVDVLRPGGGLGSGGSSLPFDDFVNVRILVKDDPSTGGGYFVISLEANEKSRMVREIPKDILLVIDRSGSISNSQFEAFKAASYRALDALHYTDRFNVVTFTSSPTARFKGFVPATPANKELAKAFVRSLNNRGTTCVFGAIEPYIRMAQRQTSRPLNIFLMTDGVSTVNIYNDDEFLRQVEGINPGHVSIFPMSVGNEAKNFVTKLFAQEANRDLMDFLGFQNRGACLHTASASGAGESMSTFISSHNDLLIRNLEYIGEAGIVRNLYPCRLQHLYRNSNVKLYGKFSAGDSSIILDVVGYDAQNQRRSLIFQGVFAECQRTNEPLDSIWAARKLLELVSQKMVAKSGEERKRIDGEIRKVSEEYNLNIAY